MESPSQALWPEVGSRDDKEFIRFIPGGQPYFDTLVGIIGQARSSIQLQVYIIDDDQTGNRIINALAAAVQRGVEVHLLVDGFGCGDLSDAFINKIREAGIVYRKFSPWTSRRKIQLGRRLHHKITVIDQSRILVTGINIADRYSGIHENPWLDFGVLVGGRMAVQAFELCENTFQKKYIINPKPQFEPIIFSDQTAELKLAQNDWLKAMGEISVAYREAISNASDKVIIVASYFLPGRRIRRGLVEAAQRGVEINLVLSAISDVKMVQRATNYLYGWLIKCNIKVYEYQKAVVHGKVAVVDKKWSTIGSYNLNHLSDYGSIELNINTKSDSFCTQLDEYLSHIIDRDCKRIEPDYIHRKSLASNLLDFFAYLFVRITLRMLLYFTQKEAV